MGCIIWELVGLPVHQEVYSATYTAYAWDLTQDEIYRQMDIEYVTLVAKARLTYTVEALTRTSTPLPPSPPAITSVLFPNEIPGDGTTFEGKLYFLDPSEDVNRLVIEVVQADNFGDADYDPRPYLSFGTLANGTFTIYNWCEGEQHVVLRYTLYDAAGLKSNSVDKEFWCTGTK